MPLASVIFEVEEFVSLWFVSYLIFRENVFLADWNKNWRGVIAIEYMAEL